MTPSSINNALTPRNHMSGAFETFEHLTVQTAIQVGWVPKPNTQSLYPKHIEFIFLVKSQESITGSILIIGVK